jgi:hypothetical protein
MQPLAVFFYGILASQVSSILIGQEYYVKTISVKQKATSYLVYDIKALKY